MGLGRMGLKTARRTDAGEVAFRLVRSLALVGALVAPLGGSLARPSAAAADPLGLSGFAAPLSSSPVAGPAAAALHAAVRAEKARVKGVSLAPSAVEPHWGCPEGTCDELIDPAPRAERVGGRLRYFPSAEAGKSPYEGGGVDGGFDPQDLQSAYKIPTAGGEDETVAVVDAYGYSAAEADLAIYRKKYGLPACTKADGCFHKINQRGEEGDYPPDEDGWDGEAALDLDMVSAACPHCDIMLAEAEDDYGESLAKTVDAAASDGASEISNSYGGSEGGGAEEEASYQHAGVLITVSAGDYGYDDYEQGRHAPQYPAVLPSVVSVGGTVLTKAANARGWEDAVWPGSGSGCSSLAKPVWQHDSACARRTDNDVAAVASCKSPVSTYDSLGSGWEDVCGTSVSSPLVAGIEAHATPYARSLPGADAFYSDPAAFFDVTSGSNGSCTPPQQDAYYCTAEEGYDAPTGNGVPDGAIELGAAAPLVSTSSAIAFSAGGVTFNGEIDPQASEASYHFEYGKSTAYGTSAPVPEGSLPASTASSAVSVTVGGLEAGATYHFRLTATNANGTSHGQDVVFSTSPPSVGSISPDTGPPDGGTTVQIDGTGFEDASAVEFGSEQALSFEVVSPEEIQAVSPSGTGIAPVTVTTPAGSSEAAAASSFAYEAPGPVLAWGSRGEDLGDGQSTASDAPVEVSGLPEVVQLAAGGQQGLALERDGRVMGWGHNSGGEVGDDTTGAKSTPVPVCAAGATEACPNGPYLEGVKAITAGATHSLALLEDGRVLAWGEGSDGQLGRGPGRYLQFSRTPSYVCTLGIAPKGACPSGHYLEEVVAIAAAGNFSLALRRNGTVVAWGEDDEGQLGTGTTKGMERCEGGEERAPETYVKVPCSGTPREVAGLAEVTALAAGGAQSFGTVGGLRSLGGDHTLALLRNGTVMAWGQDLDGELGDGSISATSSPVSVCAAGETAPCAGKLSDVTALATGEGTSAALLASGAVLTWGEESALDDGSIRGPEVCGEIGETFHDTCASTPLPSLLPDDVRAIASGGRMGMAVTSAGEVLTWGFGTLGDGVPDDLATAPTGVCAAFASGPCPDGPYLEGSVAAMAVATNEAFIGLHVGRASIAAVSPTSGPSGGGSAVTITGSGLAGTTAVSFGSTPVTSFEVLSETEIVASAPPGAGVVDVSVSGPSGTSASTRADRFAYETPPVVSSERAADVRLDSATLEGELEDGEGATSECRFEYGSGEAYGESVACGGGPEHAVELGGLQADTTYHFRVAAADAFGTVQGSDATFTTPAAELPEIGSCTKLTQPTGKFEDKACTKASGGGDSGSYEWRQGPGGKAGFEAAGAGASFSEMGEGGGAVVIDCTGSSASGTYTGPQSAELQLTLTGCAGTGAVYTGVPAESCQSEGAPAGEITSMPLSMQLGSFTVKGKSEAGWGLQPASGASVASFTCGSSHPITLFGSLIGEIRKPDKQATESIVAFATTKAHGKHPLLVQIPEGWPGALRDPIQIHVEDYGYTGLVVTSTLTLTAAEALEVKALP